MGTPKRIPIPSRRAVDAVLSGAVTAPDAQREVWSRLDSAEQNIVEAEKALDDLENRCGGILSSPDEKDATYPNSPSGTAVGGRIEGVSTRILNITVRIRSMTQRLGI